MKLNRIFVALMILALPFAAFGGTFTPQHVESVAGQYVVMFDDTTKATETDVENVLYREASERGYEVKNIMRNALHGAVIAFATEEDAKHLSGLSGIAIVTPDAIGVSSTIQTGAPYGLDRISQRTLPVDGNYVYFNNGAGVHAYIIDGPILTTHPDFGGRATNDHNSIDPPGTPACSIGSEAMRHGTAVASIVGGATYGVAKAVRIHGIQATSCSSASPSMSSLALAADYVRANGIRPGVVNVSVNVQDASHVTDTAYANLVAAGFFVSASAGNCAGTGCGTDPANSSCSTAPSRVHGVFSVGGSSTIDTQADQSVGGACISAFAPMATFAADSGMGGGIGFVGTSASAPHAAGIAALLYQSASPYIPPATSMNVVISGNTSGVITGTTLGAPNRLLYSPLPW